MSAPAKIKAASGAAMVSVERGTLWTNSLLVAEKFGKLHKNVLRAIANVECADDFRRLNFAPSSYLNEQGKEQPMCRISRDGFAFLAMGFTGKEAARWKVQFLTAFNQMERELTRRLIQLNDPEWQAARLEGKAARQAETETIKAFVDYATAQGSKSAARYYANFSKATNKALFFVEGAKGRTFRDGLTVQQVAALAMAERIVDKALAEFMAGCLFYREAYRLTMERVRAFAGLIGASAPGGGLLSSSVGGRHAA